MARKNINDTIHGDRAAIRGGSLRLTEGFTDDLLRSSASPSQAGYSKKIKEKTFGGGYANDYSSYGSSYKACYEQHPPLTLPGTDLVIFGGSCSRPAVKDADVYIGFDSGMRVGPRSWPWKKGYEFLFEIQDMAAPKNAAEFHKLVDWTKKQLEDGRKVHCGCIGGHGRTGTFLSALVSRFGEKDAVAYVRKHYCKRAVESSAQTKFLCEEFGVTASVGAKVGGHSTTQKANQAVHSRVREYTPILSNGTMFDRPVSE